MVSLFRGLDSVLWMAGTRSSGGFIGDLDCYPQTVEPDPFVYAAALLCGDVSVGTITINDQEPEPLLIYRPGSQPPRSGGTRRCPHCVARDQIKAMMAERRRAPWAHGADPAAPYDAA